MFIINPYIFGSGYTIENAIWLDGSADYLSWTPSATASSNTDKTISFWVKRVKFGSVQWVLDVASNGDQIQYTSGDKLEISLNATTDSHYTTKSVYRDPTAWTHIVIAFDTDSGTAANKKRLWINGVLQEDAVLDNHDDPADDANVDWMKASIAHNLGRRGNNSQFFAGYLAEFIGVDGTAYEASNFGEYDDNGVWVPINPSGLDFGNNGFHLNFSNANALGLDVSRGATHPGTVDLQISFDGSDEDTSTTDESANSHTVTFEGDAQLDDAQYKFSPSSLLLDGTGDYVKCADNADWRLGGGTGDFTLEFFARLASGVTAAVMVGQEQNSTTDFWAVYWNNSAGLQFINRTGSSNTIYFAQGSNSLSVETWYHIALVRSGSVFTFYVNGSSVATATDADPITDFSGELRIGHNTGSGAIGVAAFNGHIDEFRLINGGAVYNGNFTALSAAFGAPENKTNNSFTQVSIAQSQQVSDTCTDDADNNIGNYWTLNPLASTDTLTNGNLAYTGAANFSSYVTAPALPMTGKWYWEIKAVGSAAITSSANWDTYVGLVSTNVAIPTASHTGNANLWVWGNMAKDGSGANGQKHNNSSVSFVPAVNFGDNAIVMIAVDTDNNSIWFGNDGTWAGSGNPAGNSNAAFSNLSGQVMPFQSLYSDSATYNFGATAFAHTPPTGFKALNTANLAAPTVTKPNDHFKIITYEGAAVDSSSRHTASAVTLPDNTNTTFTVGGSTGSLAQIIDNNSSTAGIRITGAGGELSFDLGSAKAVGAVGMFMDNGGGNSQACTWSVLYSDNNSDFTDTSQDVAYSDNGESSSTEVIKTFSGSHGTHRYWKLRVESKTSESASSGGIYGINLYSANAHEITGVGFQPDFVWIKNRDASDNNMLFDSVRGATKDLHSNTTDTEATTAESLKSFDTDGFTLGTDDQVNTSSESYVAWCWKAGTSWSEDAQNSNILASSGKKSSTAKFSIATWEHRGGSDGNYAIKHNLGTTPEFFMTKSADQSTNWSCWHTGLSDSANRIVLTDAATEASSYWADASDSADGSGSYANISSGESPVTSTLFAIQDDEAGAGTFIGYFFARTPGLIGIGSYVGNTTNLPCVVVDDGASGFRPAWIMFKNISSSGYGWSIFDVARDTHNPNSTALNASGTGGDSSVASYKHDILANGFKIRGTSGETNGNGNTIIYLAFAEHPFGGDDVAQARAR